MSYRAPPARLARLSAASALRKSSSAVSLPASLTATPTLAVRNTSSPSTENGAATASSKRCARAATAGHCRFAWRRRELVGPGSRKEVFVTDARSQTGGNLTQQRIANAVAQPVIDILEAIEIQCEHADAVAETSAMSKLGVELAGQQCAVP